LRAKHGNAIINRPYFDALYYTTNKHCKIGGWFTNPFFWVNITDEKTFLQKIANESSQFSSRHYQGGKYTHFYGRMMLGCVPIVVA
jgi:hypothetical protein